MGQSSCQVHFLLEYQKGCDNTVADVHELGHNPLQPRHSEIGPRWNNPRSHPKGRMSWPCSSGGRPWPGERGTCCHRVGVGPNACDWLGRSPERQFSAEHGLGLVRSPEEDRSEDTLRRACLQWGGQTDLQNCQNFMIHQRAYTYAQCLRTRTRICCFL